MDYDQDNGAAGVIADLAKKASGATVVDGPDGRKFLVYPEGVKHDEITDPYGLIGKRPGHVRTSVVLQARELLGDYVNRFKTDATMLFADIAKNTIVAQIDYHDAQEQGGAANFIQHRAKMELPFSEEWRLWTSISGALKPQLEFARFLEENAPDIRVPSAGDLLDACRDLNAHRKVNFTKAVRTDSDNENFEFTAETEARTKGGLELPTRFVLNIPVYFGEQPTEVHAFLRWKLDENEGGLKLGIQLHRAEYVRQAVFKQIVTGIVERTGCPVVYGTIGGLSGKPD